jgi:LSD1 subclass zinc finger protein
MPEALKCPSCSAPLEYPAGGGPTMRCPYCNTIVMLDDAAAQKSAGISINFGSSTRSSIDLSKINDLIRSGNKIGAIKIYRQIHGVGLADAKRAIDALADGRDIPTPSINLPFNPATVTKTVTRSVRLAMFSTFGIILFVFATMFFSFHASVHQAQIATSVIPIPSGIPDLLPAAVAAPAYAHQVLEFGSEGIGPGEFKDSRTIAVSPDGRIYVGEYSDGRVQAFDPQGKFLSEWTIGKDKSLMGLAADRHGSVYAVVPFNIIRYDGETGMPQGNAESNFNGDQENYMDCCVALTGDVWAITSDSQIVDIGPDLRIKSAFSAGEKVGEDLNLERIAVLPTGEIFALDRSKGIFKFASDGRYINRFGPTDDLDKGVVIAPEGLAVDGNARVYESASNPAIRVFNSDGNPIDSFGGDDVVFGLAVDDQNNIYACYRNDHSVKKFVINKN